MRVETVVELPVPPSQAWDVLTDWERQADWMLDADRVTVRSSVREGMGVRLAVHTRIAGVPAFVEPMQVVGWDPPLRLTLQHGGPVSGTGTWRLDAVASGTWAGRAAATFAAQIAGRVDDRPVTRLGAAGLKPTAEDEETLSAAEIAETVRAEMLPLERNFFRRADALRNSLGRLDSAWSDLRRQAPADGLAAAKMREAAAMIATSRWAYASALARSESRGMHRRIDAPSSDPTFACALEAAGLDRVSITRREIGQRAPAR